VRRKGWSVFAFALKPGGGGRQMPQGFGKKDECGFLPKAATPGWK
jgi:hypothetical protein